MVKSIIYTAVAIALCLGVFIFAQIYVDGQFEEFGDALDVLYFKIEDESATREDAAAVRSMWSDKRDKLHIILPHNDISYIDYWISEACGLLYNGEYALALGKIEVLREIAKNLPKGYAPNLSNIF